MYENRFATKSRKSKNILLKSQYIIQKFETAVNHSQIPYLPIGKHEAERIFQSGSRPIKITRLHQQRYPGGQKRTFNFQSTYDFAFLKKKKICFSDVKKIFCFE